MGLFQSRKKKRKHILKLILNYAEKNGDKDDWLREYEDNRDRSSTWNSFFIKKINICYLKRLNLNKTSMREFKNINCD